MSARSGCTGAKRTSKLRVERLPQKEMTGRNGSAVNVAAMANRNGEVAVSIVTSSSNILYGRRCISTKRLLNPFQTGRLPDGAGTSVWVVP